MNLGLYDTIMQEPRNEDVDECKRFLRKSHALFDGIRPEGARGLSSLKNNDETKEIIEK